MRLIDADALINELVNSCNNDQTKMFPVWIEKQIDAQPTIPYDMRWKKTELLEFLKKARKQLKKCHVPQDERTVTLSLDTLENVLSEQPEIVRCKDCKYRHDSIWCRMYSEGMDTEDDWFCADGERRDNNALP